MPKILKQPALYLAFLLLSVLPGGCSKLTAAAPSIAVVSEVAANGSKPVGIALEQKNGYDAGFKAAQGKFTVAQLDERAPQGDTQRTVRDMVQDTKTPLVAMLGGTSNDATSHAAALANFFNIPMLVPTANGDNLFPMGNLWAFRLSAPGKAYADYLFGSIVTKQAVDKITGALDTELDQPNEPKFKVAILYEANTFGENAAVATAEAVMAQSLKIKVYGNFKTDNTDPQRLNMLARQAQEAGVQLAYLISSDPATARNLVNVLRAAFVDDEQAMPLVVGMAEGFTAQDFIASKDVEGVYVLRQQLESKGCPAAIQSSYQAQTYAAVYLLDWAVQQTGIQLGATIQQRREAIRDALKGANLGVPCLGKVAFDNAGQNKLLKLELARITKGKAEPISSEKFLEALQRRIEDGAQ